jgi:hypothetical protein
MAKLNLSDAFVGDADVDDAQAVDAGDVSLEPLDVSDTATEDTTVEQDASCSVRPPPSHLSDPADGGNLDLVFAVRELDFGGASEGWKKLGFDLDQLDTKAGTGVSTCQFTGKSSSIPPPSWWDYDCALDNAGGGLMWDFGRTIAPKLEADLLETNTLFQLGERGILLRIQGYNGMPNDDLVIVSVLETSGTTLPQWQGTDAWTVNEECLANIPNMISKYMDDNAYVAQGVVVARFDPFPIRMSLGNSANARLPLEQSLFTAQLTLDPTAGFYKLVAGRLGGTVRPVDLFRVASASNPTCLDPDTVLTIHSLACSYLDMRLPVPSGNNDLPCNAFSMGLGFEAWTAVLAGTVSAPDGPNPCGDIDCP